MEINLHPDPRTATAKPYARARFACNQIEKYMADLVLVGFPAGQGTLLVAQALWAVTRAMPFPPVAAVHLTEDMVGRFDDLPGRKSGRWLVTIGMGPLEIGRFMAWVHAQTAWQAELRAAVEAAAICAGRCGPGAQGARRRASPTLVGGIDVAQATQSLERSLTPGLLEAEKIAGVQTYSLRNEVGILAYGSLRMDPGPELTPYVERRIAGITTPFPLEYVRSSPTRAGAPVLVPVPAGYGAAAPAEVLVLAPEIDQETACAMLHRRKLDRAGDVNDTFAANTDDMQVAELPGFAGIPSVLYAAGAPNLPEVSSDDVPLTERVKVLAQLAIASLTPETYAAGHDGIRYLADALAQGIETPLTRPYQAALLALAGGAPNLDTARAWVARQRGIFAGDT